MTHETREQAAKEMCAILFDKLIDVGFLCVVILVEVAPDGKVTGARLGGTLPRKVDALRILESECAVLRAEVERNPSEQWEEEIDLGRLKGGLDS